MNIAEFEKNAIASVLFTSPVLGADLRRFLDEEADIIKKLAAKAIEDKVEHIYWVGAGNSRVNLLSGKELMDRFTTVPSDCCLSYEFIWGKPRRLGKKSLVFLASFSGGTEDTVAALRFSKQNGATTVALVDQADSLLGKEADVTIAYKSKALFSLPLAAAYIFALEYARLSGETEASKVLDDLYKVPDLLEKQYHSEKEPALALAQSFKDEEMIYTLSAGPLYGLGYKFGLTVFMENMRVNGSFIQAAEFRHGPVEMLDRHKPAFVVLKGNDDSRVMVERIVDLLKSQNVPLIVFDAKDYNPLHPLLDPFMVKIPLQWFSIYSAYLRGIYDLDKRVMMGHGVLAKGKGITWP